MQPYCNEETVHYHLRRLVTDTSDSDFDSDVRAEVNERERTVLGVFFSVMDIILNIEC